MNRIPVDILRDILVQGDDFDLEDRKYDTPLSLQQHFHLHGYPLRTIRRLKNFAQTSRLVSRQWKEASKSISASWVTQVYLSPWTDYDPTQTSILFDELSGALGRHTSGDLDLHFIREITSEDEAILLGRCLQPHAARIRVLTLDCDGSTVLYRCLDALHDSIVCLPRLIRLELFTRPSRPEPGSPIVTAPDPPPRPWSFLTPSLNYLAIDANTIEGFLHLASGPHAPVIRIYPDSIREYSSRPDTREEASQDIEATLTTIRNIGPTIENLYLGPHEASHPLLVTWRDVASITLSKLHTLELKTRTRDLTGALFLHADCSNLVKLILNRAATSALCDLLSSNNYPPSGLRFLYIT